jgi:hypothetical protein
MFGYVLTQDYYFIERSAKQTKFTSIAFGSIAIVCTMLLPSTKKYQTNRVAVQIS